MRWGRCTAFAGLLGYHLDALAEERDVTIYPNGVETFGVGIMPAPGLYYFNSTVFYEANRVNNASGASTIQPFHTRAFVNAFRFDKVWPIEFLNGNVETRLIIPLVDINATAGARSQSKVGLGDITISPLLLGWHFGDLHTVTGVDVNFPVGEWNPRDLVNTFENYVQVEPQFAVTYAVPHGPESDIKLMYDFNTINSKTNYHSGEAFHTDFAGGWNFGPLTAGLVGYYLIQTTNDTINGVTVGPDGNRTQALAIGPGLRYVWNGVGLQLNWKHDILADNHTQGNAIWLRFRVRF